MNQDQDKTTKPRRRARALLVAFLTVLVLGTGAVLVPRDPGPPPAVPFSESARAEAFSDTLSLMEAAAALRATGAAVQGTAPADVTVSVDITVFLDITVTLLTTQARALQSSGLPSAPAGSSSVPSPAPAPADFLAALAASGNRRLSDAAKADGGIARLLAAVGTAQLLQATELAGAWNLPVPGLPAPGPGTGTGTASGTETAPACGAQATPSPAATGASAAGALAAVVRGEREAVYVYQVGLARPDAAGAQGDGAALAAHEKNLREAAALAVSNCVVVPSPEAGYGLPAEFAGRRAAALAALEAGLLPAFGDLIAWGGQDTRQWAIDALLSGTQRSLDRGAGVEAFPGMVLDAGTLPPLPSVPASAVSPGR